ncbi:MAG: ABC transporter substrate-binding protein [Bacteroidota bacterium]|nr:ABC transporter substrate-binding protein [Bacteroidota bacterium]
MKKVIYSLLVAGLLASCGSENNTGGGSKKANGGVYYGGVFRMNEVEDFRNLFPLNITEVTSHRIANQVYEGLVKLSQADLTIVPCLAEKWEKNADASQWTFSLRKGVKFHDDASFADGKGREVTAKDIKYCFERLCTNSPENQQFGASFKDRVVGANEYYQSTIDKKPLAGGVSGIKVIDDYTLQINLSHPFAGFLNILSTPGAWVYPQEAFEKYGIDMRVKCVGTGPFQVKSVKEGEAVILERNPNYWNVDEHGNQLPYLDAVKFTFIKEKKSELLEFKRGNLDMIFRLPIEMIPDILGELDHAKEGNAPFEMQVVPAMSIFYYGFQHVSDVFNKKEVRLAFNYAIDREKIVNYTLQGEGVPGNYGIVPPSFKDYDSKALKGYTFDVDKAKKLLAQAGYPEGKGFPRLTLQINSGGGDRNVQTAEVIMKMLKENLNIDLDINVMPFAEHLESLETGKAQFWRTGWSADYPDPETFLTLLYGEHVPAKLSDKSYLNAVRYKSARFDSIFTAALREVDDKKRFDLYRQADQQAIDDGAIMPIFYDENYRLVQTNVKNFPANAMEYRDMTSVYIEPKKDKAEGKK